MVVYSFYIFDRHADCIYTRRWLPSQAPPPSPGNNKATARPLSSSTITPSTKTGSKNFSHSRADLSVENDAKLMFGTVFSLRNIVRKIGGEDDTFLSYRTSQYKLHHYETPTNVKFVMLTDTKAGSMRIVLHQIYVSIYVEYVVKNPLSPAEHAEGPGINNEMFEAALEQFMERFSNMST